MYSVMGYGWMQTLWAGKVEGSRKQLRVPHGPVRGENKMGRILAQDLEPKGILIFLDTSENS